ncbi:MAG TPA: M56 family metallopeptidase [Mucilaginibacter sp.]|jgi:beta-lactamase regulating signal transducer with metallopeptidase domain
MGTSFLTEWLSNREINAICWTLIHSLWIGLIIALLCGILVASTRRSAAALRYRLLCSLLVLFICAIGVVCYLEYRVPPPPPKVPLTMAINVHHNIIINHDVTLQNQTLLTSVQAFLNQNVNFIFVIWLFCFMLKSLKMVGGLIYIQRIRNYKIQAVSEELKHKIELFSNQIGIRRAVRLVQSELVKVPVAVGWLKPMILLPVGIAFQLTPEQLDGILWHELAHIRRRDYLVNILQGTVETVFFFNPGLLWLSSLIRTEREACCDDMVLSRVDQKVNYLEALLSFGYGEFKQTGLAMGIGSGNQLRDRLKRIIERENKRLNITEKAALVAGLVALSAFTSLTKINGHTSRRMANKMAEKVAKIADTPHGKIDSLVQLSNMSSKAGPTVITNINAKDIHGKTYQLKLADDKLMAMDISGRKVKESDLPEYQYMVNLFREKEKTAGAILTKKLQAGDTDPFALGGEADTAIHFLNLHYQPNQPDKANYTVSAEGADHKKFKFTVANNKLVALSINGNDVQKGDLHKYTYLLKLVPPPPPPAPMQPASPTQPPGASGGKIDTLNLVHISTYSTRRGGGDTSLIYNIKEEDTHSNRYHLTIINDKLIAMAVNGKKIKDSDLPKYEYVARQWIASQKASMALIQQQLHKPQQPAVPPSPPSLDKMISDVTNDLINEHIIKDKSGLLTVKLTYAELIVNGVKQPDEIQKKFAMKYYPGNSKFSKKPNYGLWYNARTHGVALGDFNLDLDAL